MTLKRRVLSNRKSGRSKRNLKKRTSQEQSQQQRKGNESTESVEAVKTTTTKHLDAAKSPKYDDDERKRYVESRAREIHEGMRLCKPFDVDGLRREFPSEDEVRDVKRMVRELGFEEMGRWLV